jgi:tRNA threonylcarbamoyl adenosine modification protein YeaZ
VLVLAVDTATPAVTAAAVPLGSQQAAAVRVWVDPRRHGELLGPAIREVLAQVGAAPAAVGAVVAGLGPGPFTGLRVGLVTAAAFADAAGVPLYGVCSLDAIAAGAGAGAAAGAGGPGVERAGGANGVPDRAGPGSAGAGLLVATDARRREVYWATYRDGRRRHGPAVDRPAELALRLAELGVTAMCGAGAEQYAGVLGLPLHGPAYPDPVALVALAADRIRAGAPTEPPAPLYLRRPDAEVPGVAKPVLPG